MVDTMRLYFHYLSASIRSQLQYRTSFLLMAFAQFFLTAIEFLGIWTLFDRFGNLQGWTLSEVAFFYGLIGIAFALAEAIPRGFDKFHLLIRQGDFDRLLLRPRSTVLQIMGQELQLMRIGRLVQALIILFWAGNHLGIRWTVGKVLLTLFAITGGTCLFSGLFILQATMCFWTIESLEIINVTTYGGVETGQFPISIYRPWFQKLFIFVIPLASINYFPAHAILNRPDPLGTSFYFQCSSPLLGIIFLFVALQCWHFGVRHYRSTGS
jgi:ABC-2 type transport system permease protein